MDLPCPQCGEPMDVDEFHDAEQGTYREWVTAFKTYGCAAVDAMFDGDEPSQVKTKCQRESHENSDIYQTCYELMGDDNDGSWSMLEGYF